MKLASLSPRVTRAAVLTLAVGACATPPTNATLDQARTKVSAVSSNPATNREAPEQVQRARQSLTIAESAWANDASEPEVTHRAYLALQRATLAEETARLRAAEAQIQNAGVERERLRLSAAEARNEQLHRELQELQARPTPRGQVVTLSNVLFEYDEAGLIPGATPELDRLADFLRRNPDYIVSVEGYTDNTGNDSYNLGLSQRRADTVRAALVQRGIDPARVQARGLGEGSPVASNDTAQGRQLNRRVELVLTSPTAPPTASGAATTGSGTTGTVAPTR